MKLPLHDMSALVLGLAALLGSVLHESDIVPTPIFPIASETEPEINVTVTPKGSIKPGMLVRIDASLSDVDEGDGSLQWDNVNLPQNSFDYVGRIGFFAASPGVHEIIIAGGKTVAGKSRVVVKRVRIQVDGTAPIPPPPEPVDPITPTPPSEGRFGLTAFTRDLAIQMNDRETCEKIAENYANVVKAMKDGEFASISGAAMYLVSKNKVVVGETKRPNWTIKIWNPLTERLNQLMVEKRLTKTSFPDIQDAYEEVGLGFKAAAK